MQEYDAEHGRALICVKNRFAVGDWLELIRPGGNQDLELSALHNQDGEAISVAPGSGHFVWAPLPPTPVGTFVARYVQGKPDHV